MNPYSHRLPVNFAKLLIVASVLYSSVISFRYFMIPHLSALLIYAALGATIFQYGREVLETIRSPFMIAYALFCGLNAVLSYSTAVNFDEAMHTIGGMWESGLIILMILSISRRDGDIKFGSILLLCIALAMAAIMIHSPALFNESYMGHGTQYLTIAENVNPHTVGACQLFGIWALLIYGSYSKSNAFKVAVTLLISLTFFYVAVIANSRKTILSMALLLLLAAKPYYLRNIQSLKTSQKFGGALLLALFSVGFFLRAQVILSRFLTSNNIIERFTSFFDGGSSNESRFNMILEAFRCFASHPFFGVGINNFRYHSSFETYSHNSYAELAVSCGIIGMTPFIYFFIKGLKPLFASHVYPYSESNYRRRLSIVLVFILLFLCGAQIIFYQDALMTALGILMSYGLILQDEEERERRYEPRRYEAIR